MKALIGGEGGILKFLEKSQQHPSNQFLAVVFLKQGWLFFSSSIESIDWQGEGGSLKFLEKSQQHPSNQLVAVVFLKRGGVFFNSSIESIDWRGGGDFKVS